MGRWIVELADAGFGERRHAEIERVTLIEEIMRDHEGADFGDERRARQA